MTLSCIYDILHNTTINLLSCTRERPASTSFSEASVTVAMTERECIYWRKSNFQIKKELLLVKKESPLAKNVWLPRMDSNHLQRHYRWRALPLSYEGTQKHFKKIWSHLLDLNQWPRFSEKSPSRIFYQCKIFESIVLSSKKKDKPPFIRGVLCHWAKAPHKKA